MMSFKSTFSPKASLKDNILLLAISEQQIRGEKKTSRKPQERNFQRASAIVSLLSELCTFYRDIVHCAFKVQVMVTI